MAERGPVGSFLFLNLRLLNDQTLENATGVGSPPWTWRRDEQAIDLLHKAIYAFTTGAVTDWFVAAPALKADGTSPCRPLPKLDAGVTRSRRHGQVRVEFVESERARIVIERVELGNGDRQERRKPLDGCAC